MLHCGKGDKMKEAFYDNVFAIVQEIPVGSVATYQQIASLSGHPKNARLVGRALRESGYFGEFPCHRVVHHDGGLVLGWEEQRDLLLEEGIAFLKNGKVDMKRYQWKLK